MFTVRKIDDTRPSRACGVTVCRSVVELIVHRIGPTPNRKNAKPASTPDGHSSVATIVAMAATDTTGPTTTTVPNGSAARKRGAASAPITMPAP